MPRTLSLFCFCFCFNNLFCFFLTYSRLLKPATAARLRELLKKDPEASIARQYFGRNDFEDSAVATSSDSDDDGDDDMDDLASAYEATQADSRSSDFDDDDDGDIEDLARAYEAYQKQEDLWATSGINAQPQQQQRPASFLSAEEGGGSDGG
jgi:hypothetical protein